MITRQEWSRACRLARTGGSLQPTLANLRAAYLTVNNRVDWSAIQGLALE